MLRENYIVPFIISDRCSIFLVTHAQSKHLKGEERETHATGFIERDKSSRGPHFPCKVYGSLTPLWRHASSSIHCRSWNTRGGISTRINSRMLLVGVECPVFKPINITWQKLGIHIDCCSTHPLSMERFGGLVAHSSFVYLTDMKINTPIFKSGW